MSIEIASVSYEKGNKKILDDISLEIKSGEVLSILGPNGAGKSTLLNLISGDIFPNRGEIYFDNKNLKDISIQERSFMRSVMAQSQAIVFDFSVKEIIEMGWLDKGLSNYANDFEDALNEIAEETSVTDLLFKKFNVLSGGEQRRVHFARTLLQIWRPSNSLDPIYILLDEPTANLDILHEQKMMKKIRSKASQGIGVMIVLHDINIAAKYSDKIAFIKEGRLEEIGSPSEVLEESKLSEIYELPMKINENPFRITY